MSYRRGGRGGRGGGANHDEDRPTWKPRGGGGSSSFGGAGGRGRGGRGGEGRGKGGGGGRGRGRGAFSYTDMSSMAHDYSESSSKLRLSEPELDVDVDDEVANGQTTSGQAAASQQRSKARDSTSATVEGYTRPKPSFKPVFTLQPESDVAVQATRHQPSQSSLPDFIPARTEAAPINQSMPHQAAVSTYHAKRTAHLGIGAQQQQQQPFAHSGGYGGQGSTFRAPTFGARQPERSRAGYPSDPNLLVPMTFVKSTKRIEPTMDGKEHDELLHKRKMEQAFGKDTLPQHLVGLGEHKENVPAQPISTTMQTSLSSSSSRSSRSQMATPLSPHAKPFHSPRLAAAPVDQIESHQPFYAFLRGSPRQASDKGKQRAVLPVESDPEPLFFIDSVGERATTTGPDDEAEAESDTEEIYPRHVESRAAPATAVPPPMPSSHSAFPSLPDRFAAQSSISVPEPPAVPVHLPLKPYAQTITDDISYAPAVTAAAVSTELPPAAVEFLRSATASFNSAASRSKDAPPARKVSAKQKRKEAKERKKERKRAKKENRRPAHSLDKEKEARRPRVGESDVEWGSDGPPDMGDESDSGDSKDGDVQMPGGAQSSVLRANVAKGAKPAGRKGRGKRDDAIEAALADILAQPADSDDDDSDAREESQRAMRSFVDSFSMRAGEHLTLDDLDDLDRMRVEDGEGEYTTTAQGSGSDEDEEDDLRYEQKAIMKEFVRAEVTAKQPENTTGESSARDEFPVYVPELAEPPIDSDMDDSRNEIWKTDDESDLEDEEAARVKWQLKGDRFMRDQRAQLADSVEGSVSVGRDLEMKIEIADETTILIVSDDDEEAEQEDEDEEESESESEEDDEDEFDIDDMLEDDIDALIMSGLQPSRRKANKQPPSTKDTFFDAHLQKQWQADRQKKALKKQERALARAEKNPNRSNKRKAKRAAGQARGFSARDDEGDMMLEFDLNGSARIPEFHKINEDLRKFIENSGSMQYELPPMDKKFRYAIHDLAAAYNLKSKSRGVGRARHNVLYRTQHTTVRGANMRKVQKFLSITATWSSGANKSFSYDHPRGNGKGGGGGRKPGNANAGGGNAFVTRNYEGALVGEGADRIDSTNLGHQLLAKMGWTEGMQIGRNGGIDEPISAVIKTSKAGLGSGYVRYNRGVSSSMQVPAAGGSGGNTGWGTPVAMEG